MSDRPSQSAEPVDYLALDDKALLAQCDVKIHRSSGPGGQHRNKVSTACSLHHGPTGVSAQAYDSRSQADNRRNALKRVRMKIACEVRRAVAVSQPSVPKIVASCLFTPRQGQSKANRRLQVGRRDQRFWPVGQFLLDLLDACNGGLADAARALDIGTSNFISVLKADRHLLAAAQAIRKRCGAGPIK